MVVPPYTPAMSLRIPPLPHDPARVERTLADLAEGGFTPPDAAAKVLLDGAFGNSPYLARLALREPETLAAYFASGPEAVTAAAVTLALNVGALAEEAEAMAALR